MEHTPDAFADALQSGDSDRVNRVVDAVENMELVDRAALFDECFEVCREVYEDGDGYQRQSAIRFAEALYPRLAYRAVGGEFTDDALPGSHTVEETATHRDRLRDLYLAAIVDDDGRVRRATAKAIKELALAAKMIRADDEHREMLETLASLAATHPESVTKHVEQAYDNVAFHARNSISVEVETGQADGERDDSGGSTENLDRYRRYRTVGQELNGKLLRECADREAILESARLLGIELDGSDVLYETESQMPVHYDFLLNEYRQNGTTAVERYYDQQRWDTEIERRILEGLLEAETSLFEVTAVDDATKSLTVTDCLADDAEEIDVTDVNLSETAQPGVLLFFRLVQYDDFNVTSGVSLPFPASEKERLCREYERRIDRDGGDARPEAVQRFLALFDLYRDYGIHVQYR